MFGNAPKALWERWIQSDSRNRIPLTTRALLVEDGEKKYLFETGIGSFFEPKYRERYGVIEKEHVLLASLETLGVSHEDIDAVVLSHLHFDHAGGLLAPYEEGKEKRLLFPNAHFVCGAEAFKRAESPHQRDRASFIPELPHLLTATGRLEIVDGTHSEILGPDYFLRRSDGHTPGMLLSEIKDGDVSVVFCADLIPGAPWVHLPITMGYDRFAEKVIDEKAELLSWASDTNAYLFYTHDADVAISRVSRNDRGKFEAVDTHEELVRKSLQESPEKK